jgi:hypothetical protein
MRLLRIECAKANMPISKRKGQAQGLREPSSWLIHRPKEPQGVWHLTETRFFQGSGQETTDLVFGVGDLEGESLMDH